MRAKYGNVKTVVDGIAFDSKKEARRFGELVLLQRAGRISGLRVHVPFDLFVNGTRVCTYEADFVYVESGAEVVEDCKSAATRRNPTYRLKAKMMAAQGVVIRET